MFQEGLSLSPFLSPSLLLPASLLSCWQTSAAGCNQTELGKVEEELLKTERGHARAPHTPTDTQCSYSQWLSRPAPLPVGMIQPDGRGAEVVVGLVFPLHCFNSFSRHLQFSRVLLHGGRSVWNRATRSSRDRAVISVTRRHAYTYSGTFYKTLDGSLSSTPPIFFLLPFFLDDADKFFPPSRISN